MAEQFEERVAGFTFRAVVLPSGRSPFSEWYEGLDNTQKVKVLAGLKNTAQALAGGHDDAAGRISKLTEHLNELRITKKSQRRGPHLRAVVPRPTVAEDGTTVWLVEGFKKQTNAIEARDLERSKGTFDRWRAG